MTFGSFGEDDQLEYFIIRLETSNFLCNECENI